MITNTVSNWLQRIGQPESFLKPSIKEISDHDLILDRDVVIDRITKAIRSGESIICYGDYDCDGMGAACILTDAIRQMGGRITPMLASRFSGGYGFSEGPAQKVLTSGATLLITCDCGSSDYDRLKLLRDNGIDSVVIDHHLVPKEKLPSIGFLNPHQPGCASTFKHMCSAGLALSVIGGLKKKLGLTDFKVNQFLDICAISTIADVMPLTFDNRTLVRFGLEAICKAERPGIRALFEINKIEPGTFFSGRDVAFKLAPALNAPGRLGPPDIIVDLLLEKDITRARELASQVKDLWDRRRVITEEMTEEAVKRITEHAPAIVIGDPHWGHGIVGIVAARLVDKFNVPVCVLGHEGRGSLRGPPGSRLHAALTFCKDHLIKFGGHEAAAGCQADWNQLDNFRQKFCEFFEQNPPVKPEDAVDVILDLNIEDNLLEVCEDIQKCEPCGQSNPRPVIQTQGMIKSLKFVKGDHLKFELELDNRKILPCFKLASPDNAQLSTGQSIVVQGDLRKNTWNGRSKAEMFVSTIKGL